MLWRQRESVGIIIKENNTFVFPFNNEVHAGLACELRVMAYTGQLPGDLSLETPMTINGKSSANLMVCGASTHIHLSCVGQVGWKL